MDMICQLCGKRTANICINIDMNGVKSQRFLCEKCADERKLREHPSSAAIIALVNEINAIEEKNAADSEKDNRTCPTCGTTYKNYLKTLLLGCGNCYECFHDLLEPIIAKTTKPLPQNDDSKQVPTDASHNEILKLKLKLQQAVNDEDYESAAKLRDEIRSVEAKADGEK